jgi:hypothetical protein
MSQQNYVFFYILLLSISFSATAQNNALNFDGIDDYVVIPDNDLYDFGVNDDFTVEVSLKTPSTPQVDLGNIDNDIVEKWSQFGGYPFVIRYFRNTNTIVAARFDGTNSPNISSTTMVNDDQWHHIAFVKDGSTLLLYVDGVLEGSTFDTTVDDTRNSSGLYLGRRGNGTLNHWRGCMDDLRIWNIARSEAQINADLGRRFSQPLPSNLVLYYTFNQGIANGDNSANVFVSDKSSNSINGSINGFTSLNGSYLEFDGIDDYIEIPDNDAIDFDTDDDFTIETRLRIPSAAQVDLANFDNDIIEKWQGSPQYSYVVRYINQGPNLGKIRVARYADPDFPGIVSTTVLNDDNWHDIAFVKDGTNLYLYIDGVLEGSTIDNTVNSTLNNSPVFLGRRGNGINRWKGDMDHLRIWNVAKSQGEIVNNISTSFVGSEIGLTLCYNFNEGPIAVVPNILDDLGPGNIDGSLVNFALSGSVSNWVGSGAFAIPTLGQWGIIICFLLMMVFGVKALQRRSVKLAA